MLIYLFLSLVVLLNFTVDVLAIDAGQLKLQINEGLAVKRKYVFNAIVQFEDDILATW